MLLQRNAVIIGNPAMDITQPWSPALDAKITQFAFDRERLTSRAWRRRGAGGAPPIVQTPGPAPRPATPQEVGSAEEGAGRRS